MRTEYVLVDFENVQPKKLALLNGGSYKIKVFLGTNQAKIPVDMARALQTFGPHAEYIQISGNGPNAVDFHIAYYIGRLAAGAPDCHFQVISKDTGFDPLLKHLREQGISCQRSAEIADIPAGNESMASRIDAVVKNLAKRAGKPRTSKTLRTTLHAHFGGRLTEEELDLLIEQLTSRKLLKIVDDKVQYTLPV